MFITSYEHTATLRLEVSHCGVPNGELQHTFYRKIKKKKSSFNIKIIPGPQAHYVLAQIYKWFTILHFEILSNF